MFLYNKTLRLDAEGLGVFLFPYQEDAVRYLYAVEEANSREVWEHVNRPGAPDPKSRASVINLMDALVEGGLVAFRERSGKGGYHRVYKRSLEYPTLEAFTRELVGQLLDKVSKEFNVTIGYRYVDRECELPLVYDDSGGDE